MVNPFKVVQKGTIMTQIVSKLSLQTKDGHQISAKALFSQEVNAKRLKIVLGHGMLSSTIFEDQIAFPTWDEVSEQVAIDLLRYDALGHGESDKPETVESYTWHRMAENFPKFNGVMSGLEQGAEIILGGTSMGAATALWSALLGKQAIKGLVLIIPPTAWEVREQKAGDYFKMAQIARSGGMPQIIKTLDRAPNTPFVEREYPALIPLARENLRSYASEHYANLLEAASRSNLPSRSEIGEIDLPTLILCRIDDPVHPVEMGVELHSLMRNSTLKIAKTGDEVRSWPKLVAKWIEENF